MSNLTGHIINTNYAVPRLQRILEFLRIPYPKNFYGLNCNVYHLKANKTISSINLMGWILFTCVISQDNFKISFDSIQYH